MLYAINLKGVTSDSYYSIETALSYVVATVVEQRSRFDVHGMMTRLARSTVRLRLQVLLLLLLLQHV